jgi:hypothetical protein
LKPASLAALISRTKLLPDADSLDGWCATAEKQKGQAQTVRDQRDQHDQRSQLCMRRSNVVVESNGQLS